MCMAVRNKVGAMSTREVTVEQVEEWWKNSTRRAKGVDVIEKEEQIVEVYNRIKQQIGMKWIVKMNVSKSLSMIFQKFFL